MKRLSLGIQRARSYIERGIAEKIFTAGNPLPPVKQLSERLGLSSVTVIRAIKILKRKGILSGKPGQRTIVGPDSSVDYEGSLATDDYKNFSLPLWLRIRDAIRKDIYNGHFRHGRAIPGQKQLCVRYECSYPTIKKALESLVVENELKHESNRYIVPSRFHALGDAQIILMTPVAGYRGESLEYEFFLEGLYYDIEKECARRRVRLNHIHYKVSEQDISFFSNTNTKITPDFYVANIFGFLLYIPCPRTGSKKMIQYLRRYKKPISIYDNSGNERFPDLSKSNIPVFTYSGLVSSLPGEVMGRYLISKGHKKVAYISPLHKARWSKRRLEGIKNVFERAGYLNGVAEFTLDSYQQEIDFLPDVEKHFDINAFKQTLTGWTKKMPEKYLASLRKYLNLLAGRALGEGEMRRQTEILCVDALSNREITAWIGANDLTASFAQDYLKEKSPTVRQAVAIVGFDNNTIAMQNRLTSYDLNLLEVTHSLINNILYKHSIKHTIEGYVVERESSTVS